MNYFTNNLHPKHVFAFCIACFVIAAVRPQAHGSEVSDILNQAFAARRQVYSGVVSIEGNIKEASKFFDGRESEHHEKDFRCETRFSDPHRWILTRYESRFPLGWRLTHFESRGPVYAKEGDVVITARLENELFIYNPWTLFPAVYLYEGEPSKRERSLHSHSLPMDPRAFGFGSLTAITHGADLDEILAKLLKSSERAPVQVEEDGVAVTMTGKQSRFSQWTLSFPEGVWAGTSTFSIRSGKYQEDGTFLSEYEPYAVESVTFETVNGVRVPVELSSTNGYTTPIWDPESKVLDDVNVRKTYSIRMDWSEVNKVFEESDFDYQQWGFPGTLDVVDARQTGNPIVDRILRRPVEKVPPRPTFVWIVAGSAVIMAILAWFLNGRRNRVKPSRHQDLSF
jgi:hypothetical protein